MYSELGFLLNVRSVGIVLAYLTQNCDRRKVRIKCGVSIEKCDRMAATVNSFKSCSYAFSATCLQVPGSADRVNHMESVSLLRDAMRQGKLTSHCKFGGFSNENGVPTNRLVCAGRRRALTYVVPFPCVICIKCNHMMGSCERYYSRISVGIHRRLSTFVCREDFRTITHKCSALKTIERKRNVT